MPLLGISIQGSNVQEEHTFLFGSLGLQFQYDVVIDDDY
jgi:hypothetical protein